MFNNPHAISKKVPYQSLAEKYDVGNYSVTNKEVIYIGNNENNNENTNDDLID